MVVIKRYPNRKLYDTEARRYITLKALASKIQQGEEVQVIDYESGEDLTALTLSQILMEQHKEQSGFVPRAVLAGLIQAGGSRLSSFQRGLTSTLGLNRLVEEEIRRRLEMLVDESELAPEEAQRLVELLLKGSVSAAAHPALDEDLVEKVLDERGIPTRSELQALLSQLEALTERLDQIDQEEAPPGV